MFKSIIGQSSPSRTFKESKTVIKEADARLPTEFGEFRIAGYRSLTSDEEFVAVYKGNIREAIEAAPVRIHSQCLTGDVFHSSKCDCGPQLRFAMETIAEAGVGAVVYQHQEGRGIGIINKIKAYSLQDEGADTIEANERLGLEVDLREYGQCVEILKDLGFEKVELMSNNPEKLMAVEEGGIELVNRIPIEFEPSEDTENYLSVKKLQMGHLLDLA